VIVIPKEIFDYVLFRPSRNHSMVLTDRKHDLSPGSRPPKKSKISSDSILFLQVSFPGFDSMHVSSVVPSIPRFIRRRRAEDIVSFLPVESARVLKVLDDSLQVMHGINAKSR